MPVFYQFAKQNANEFVIPWISIPVFNLAKYVLMTYIIGLVWDFAYIRVVETKRYLSLLYTGKFSVARFGRSRNNLFSGSNFETICSMLRERFLFFVQEDCEEDDAPPDRNPQTRLSPRCILFEVATLSIILLLICAEAASEVYTSSVVQPKLKIENRSSPVRRNTSEVLFDTVYNSSLFTDITFVRRCLILNENGQRYVTRPNIIAESGKFNPSQSEIPTYDLTKLCFFDQGDRFAFREVKHTLFESQKSHGRLDKFLSHTGMISSFIDVDVLGRLEVPHFSNVSLSKEEKLRRYFHLLLVKLNGITYTCTRIHEWCVRIHENAYEVIILSYGQELNAVYQRNRTRSILDYMKKVEVLPPFRISFETLPLLATDRFMMRPRTRGPYLSDIEEVINVLAVGYTYGWTTEELKNHEVIVEKKDVIVPTVQVGYVVALCIIVLCSCLILVAHEFASRSRKIIDLVGEHAFIDRWHGHLARDGKWSRTHGRTKLIVCSSDPSVGHLQPAVGGNASAMSNIGKMM